MRHYVAYLLIFGVGGAFWAVASPKNTVRASRINTRPAYNPKVTALTIETWEARVISDPGALAFGKLAEGYLARFRETGDETDLALAEKAARQSLKVRTIGNYGALRSLAACRMSQHDFVEAAELASKIELGQPLSAAYLTAECALETGQYEKASIALAKAATLAEKDPYGLTLRARLAEVRGQDARAEDYYQQAITLIETKFETPMPTLAWFHGRLAAFYQRTGKLENAEKQCQLALEIFPNDFKLRTLLAQIAITQGNVTQAAAEASASLALHPTFEAEAVLADTDPSVLARLMTKIQNDTIIHAHDRAVANFLSDHRIDLAKAEALARREVKMRGDLFAYDALAWALCQQKKYAEAEPLIQKALQSGIRDAKILSHAAAIQSGLTQIGKQP
jgi:tetratricopeptide (TPR) repeat protein